MVLLAEITFRYQALELRPVPLPSEDQKDPLEVKLEKPPEKPRTPPGRAVKPEEFVAPVFGEAQPHAAGCIPVLFNAPPAFIGTPSWSTRVLKSASDGTRQPEGHNPLLSFTV
jgi:hypothetical protein